MESESEVTQLCPTLCDPMDCSLPGSPIPGILQAKSVLLRLLEKIRLWILAFYYGVPLCSFSLHPWDLQGFSNVYLTPSIFGSF